MAHDDTSSTIAGSPAAMSAGDGDAPSNTEVDDPFDPSPLPQPSNEPSAEERAARFLPDKLGRYDVLFELARGGMGVVYVARGSGPGGFGVNVAIKRLKRIDATDQDIAAFISEARLSARINHPNVVPTFELGDDDGNLFLVMPLVEGVSLARLLRKLDAKGALLDPRAAAWIAREAALGLHAAHELRDEAGEHALVVHRDVSPENLLLSFEGRVSVADFGVAKYAGADRATGRGVLKGKIAYMSPEQVRGEAIDRRSDLFSLGIVIYESLVGRRLFVGGSHADTLRRILDYYPPDPRDERPEIPEALAAITMRCLQKDPAERCATAGDVAAALRAFLSGGDAFDAGDLEALLARHFPGDREALHDRIRAAKGARGATRTPLSVPRPERPIPTSPPPPVEEPYEPSRTAERASPPNRTILLVSAAAACAGVLLAIWIGRSQVMSSRPEPPLPSGPSVTANAPPLTAEPLPASSSSIVAAPPPPAASASAAPASSGSAKGAPAKAPSTGSSPVPSASHGPLPAVNPSSKRGVPFQTLGD